MTNSQQTRGGRGAREGYALIMILFAAAVVSIMLAKTLPRDAMSAQRIREERLINHGEEYARAIKLYFREHKKYPEDLDDLEETDGVRYLRRRYKDPITGDDEWRLIHMGTDGRFKDSLLHDLEDEEGDASGMGGMSGTGGMRGGSMGGNRVTTSWANGRNPFQQAGAVTGFDGGARALQERESAAPDNPLDRSNQGPYGGPFPGQEGLDGQQQEGDQPQIGPDGQPLPPDYSRVRPGDVPFDAGQVSAEQLANQQAMQAAAAQAQASGGRGGFGMRRDARQSAFGGFGANAANQQAQQAPGAGGFNAQGGVAPQAADVIQRLLTTPRPGGLAGLRGSQNSMQQMQGQQGMNQFQEGIAGVASKSQATGVKVYQGEENFNLWEFVYDYRQDQSMSGMMPGAAGGMGPGNIAPGQPGLNQGGMLGGAPGGGAMPGAFGGAVPGMQPGAQQPGAQPGMLPGMPQPGNDPRQSGFGNPTSPAPYTPPTSVPSDPSDRPQRGTGGSTIPGVIPTLPGQQILDPTAPNPNQDAAIQQMLEQQLLMQQQQQQMQRNSRTAGPSAGPPGFGPGVGTTAVLLAAWIRSATAELIAGAFCE